VGPNPRKYHFSNRFRRHVSLRHKVVTEICRGAVRSQFISIWAVNVRGSKDSSRFLTRYSSAPISAFHAWPKRSKSENPNRFGTHENFVRNVISNSMSLVATNEAHHYRRLEKDLPHEHVTHFQMRIRTCVHTQSIESFWSLLKRGIIGSYYKGQCEVSAALRKSRRVNRNCTSCTHRRLSY
jgi:hypothetical protein